MKNYTRKAITLLIAILFVMGTTFMLTPESKAADYYTISFETNGGTPIDSFQIIPGTSPEIPDEPTKNGYIFEGWYSDEDLTEPFIFGSTPVTRDTTIYVKWIKVITGLDIKVTIPEAGTEVTVVNYEQSPKATAVINSDECTGAAIGIVKEPNGEEFFEGTIEEGKDYYVEVYLESNDSTKFVFTNDSVIKVNGSSDFVKAEFYEDIDGWSAGYLLFAKVNLKSNNEEEEVTTPEEEEDEPTTSEEEEADAEDDEDDEEVAQKSKSVKAGDSVVVYASMFAIAIAGITYVVINKRK